MNADRNSRFYAEEYMNYRTINLNKRQILAIPENTPEKLFSGDLENARSEFYRLGRIWHPDRNADLEAPRVFQHITNLYQKAKEMIKTDSWTGRGELIIYQGRDPVRTVSFL